MTNPGIRPETHTAEHLPIEPLLNASEVAGILGCSRALVYRMADRGQLPCVRWECPGEGTKKPRQKGANYEVCITESGQGDT